MHQTETNYNNNNNLTNKQTNLQINKQQIESSVLITIIISLKDKGKQMSIEEEPIGPKSYSYAIVRLRQSNC